MFVAAAAAASHPVVAGFLGLGAAGLAAAVIAMAWSVQVHQIRLGEQLARRQFAVGSEAGGGAGAEDGASFDAAVEEVERAANAGLPPGLAIDGPDTVIAGDQARYRVLSADGQQVVAWAAGGGAVAHAPDPAHPDELLLIADQPGDLTVSVRVREGMTERRATKSVTAVADVAAPAPLPVTLRLFLHGWGLVAVAVLVIGFAGALVALGSLSSADFIALVAPLATVLGVLALTRGSDDLGSRLGRGTAGPRA